MSPLRAVFVAGGGVEAPGATSKMREALQPGRALTGNIENDTAAPHRHRHGSRQYSGGGGREERGQRWLSILW